MSDPTEIGQRNPLSSSASHASGTSALSISVQAAGAPAMSMTPQEDVDAPASHPDAEANILAHTEPEAEARSEPEAEASPEFEVEARPEPEVEVSLEPEAEAITEAEAEISQLQAAELSDEPAVAATEQSGPAHEPEAVVELAPSPEAAPEAPAEYSPPAVETHAEDTTANPDDQPLIAASVETAVEATDEIAAVVEETADTAAADEPAYIADAVADLDEASSDMASFDEDVAPDAPLPIDTFPEEATSELLTAARQSIAENEARQEQALALFDQVSRRFTAALEEAGVDAARLTFKVMEFAQASMKNNLELAKSYTAARSVPDIFGLHAAYLARQFELLNAQAEELREITSKLTLRSTASLKPPSEPAVKALDNR